MSTLSPREPRALPVAAVVDNDVPDTVRSSEMEQEMVSVRHSGKVDVHPNPKMEVTEAGNAINEGATEAQGPKDDDRKSLDALNHSFDEIEEYEERDFEELKAKVALSWEDITIETTAAKKGRCGKKAPGGAPRKILDGITGYALPGEFVSIIGASGAGKTTLLNHLSGRLLATGLKKSGEIKVNGQNKDEVAGFSQFTAYVQQDDVLYQTFTVRECLEFSAKLQMSGGFEERMRRVQQIIDDLKLNKCENTKIGGPLIKGVSGGERKRTSIGVELITNPSLIFLDEPTTGLDSYTATQVMRTLRDLANSGRTIVQTIHQPNSDIFELFDKLMLLA